MPASLTAHAIRWLVRAQRLSWPVLEQFAWPASQLVLAPLLLKRIGNENYGLWVLALTIQLGAPALSLGRSSTLLVLVPQQQASGAPLGWLLRSVLRPLLWTGPLILAIAGIAGWNWPFGSTLARDHLALFALQAVALVVVTEIDNCFAFVLKGLAQFRVAALAEAAGRFTQVMLCAGLVTFGNDVHRVLWIALACTLVKAAMKAAAVRAAHVVDDTASLPSSQQRVIRREQRALGGWNVLQVASGLIFFGYDRWLVGFNSGAGAVAAYGICSQYVQFSHSIASAACLPLVPWAARQCGADGKPADLPRMRRMLWVATAACCLPVTAAWLFSGVVLSHWIGPAFAADNAGLIDRISIVFVLLALNVPFVNVLIGLRRSRFVALLSLASGASLVAASWVWPPADAFAMVDLKVGFAVLMLATVGALMHLLRRPAASPTR